MAWKDRETDKRAEVKRRKETKVTRQRSDGKEIERFVLEERESTKAGGDKRTIRSEKKDNEWK